MKTIFLIVAILGLFVSSTLFVSDVYASIYLDKGKYTWTDKINIRVTEHGVDSQGASVTVSTSDHELRNYKLSKAGNGLFTGQVTLTGFSHDANGNGKSDTIPRTTGSGSNNGFLETDRDDEFTISTRFADGDEIKKNCQN